MTTLVWGGDERGDAAGAGNVHESGVGDRDADDVFERTTGNVGAEHGAVSDMGGALVAGSHEPGDAGGEAALREQQCERGGAEFGEARAGGLPVGAQGRAEKDGAPDAGGKSADFGGAAIAREGGGGEVERAEQQRKTDAAARVHEAGARRRAEV